LIDLILKLITFYLFKYIWLKNNNLNLFISENELIKKK